MNKEKQDMELMRLDIQKQADIFEQDIKEEKKKLEISKTELKKKKENIQSLFDEINREKTNIKDLSLQVQTERDKLQTVMNNIALKQKEQELREYHIRRQTQELATSNNSVLAEREELEVLRKDLKRKKDEVEAAMNRISGEREQLSHMKISFEMERQVFENDKDEIEGKMSDLKMRDDQLTSDILCIQTLRGKLKELNEKTCRHSKTKIDKLDQNNKYVQRLCLVLEKMLEDFSQETDQMLVYNEQIQREKADLKGISSNMIMQRETMENQWKNNLLLEKDLEKLKAELKNDREDLDKVKEMMNKEKLDLEQIRLDIHKQINTLEIDVKEKMDIFELEKNELESKKQNLDCLLDDINREKMHIKDLTIHVQTEKDNIENVINMTALKQEENKVEDVGIQREIKAVETSPDTFLVETEELQLLKMHVNMKQQDSFSGERDQLCQKRFSIDEEREMRLNEKDQMGSVITLRSKLNELNVKMTANITHKINRLEQNKKCIQKLCTVLEQKLSALDVQKENMACYTEVLEREKSSLISVRSDMVIQREDNEWKQMFKIKKQGLENLKAELKLDREDLDRVNEMMNKEKQDLEFMRSDTQKRTDIFGQDIKEEKDKLDITKEELQSRKENIDFSLEMNQEKEQLNQIKTIIEIERDVFSNENKRMKVDLSELKIRADWFISVMNSMGSLRAKLIQLNQRTHEDFQNNLERLDQKNRDILELNSILEHKCDELDKQKIRITGYYDLIQRERKHVVTTKFDKVVQTEVVSKEWLQEQDVKKQDLKLKESECGIDVPQLGVAVLNEESEHQWKLDKYKRDFGRKGKHLKTEREGLLVVVDVEEVENEQKQKLATLSESVVKQDDFTDDSMSKRDCLRNIWKDTKIERKEIDQMKRRGYELRNNLEKRLKVINQFVKRTWLQKEKEPLEKTKLEQGLSKDTTSQSDCERNHKTLDEKHTELQQLKVQMLSEIEKLHIKEKVSRTLKTSDKANQTFQVNVTTWDATVQVTEEASTKMYKEQVKVEETEAAPETTSGLLCHLRHFCYRCCCSCCACCKQVWPEDK